MSVAGFEIPPLEGTQEKRINLRAQPPEWRDLYETAQQCIDPDLPLTGQANAAGILWDKVLAMPTKHTERARYYAAGLIICLVANELVLPGKRDELAEAASIRLAAEHENFIGENNLAPGRGLYGAECVITGSDELNGPDASDYILEFLRPAVADRYARLSVAERLVASTLRAAMPAQKARLYPPYEEPMTREERMHCILQHEHGLEMVMSNAFGGANGLVRSLLTLKADGLTDDDPLALSLADIVTSDELTADIPPVVAKQAATMRTDQLHNIGRYAQLVDDVLLLDVPRPAGALPPPNEGNRGLVYLHDETLICPAVEVRAENADGEIEALIPMMVPLLVDTISRAQSILLAEGR